MVYFIISGTYLQKNVSIRNCKKEMTRKQGKLLMTVVFQSKIHYGRHEDYRGGCGGAVTSTPPLPLLSPLPPTPGLDQGNQKDLGNGVSRTLGQGRDFEPESASERSPILCPQGQSLPTQGRALQGRCKLTRIHSARRGGVSRLWRAYLV